jgi:hypothetical protein
VKPADNKPPEVITRFYDVRALAAPTPDFTFDNSPHAGGFVVPAIRNDLDSRGRYGEGSSGGILFSGESRVLKPGEEMEILLKTITDIVAPETWRDNGGTLGSLRESHGILIVMQTIENQKSIAELLHELSERRHRAVRTTADWLLLKPADLSKLQQAGADKDHPGLFALDPAAFEKLAAENVHFHADLLGDEGQIVHYVSGRERSQTVNETAVVGTDVSAYQPIVANLGAGIALQVNPAIERETRRAVVSVFSTYTQMRPPGETIPVRTAATTRSASGQTVLANEASASYREVDGIVQELRCTVGLPLGVPVIVGAMTLEPNVDHAQGEILVLVLRVDSPG